MYYAKGPVKQGPADVVFVPVDMKYLIFLEDGNSKLLFNLLNQRQIVLGSQKPEEVFAHFFSYEMIKDQKPELGQFESIRVSTSTE
jgi:hypothetical protein